MDEALEHCLLLKRHTILLASWRGKDSPLYPEVWSLLLWKPDHAKAIRVILWNCALLVGQARKCLLSPEDITDKTLEKSSGMALVPESLFLYVYSLTDSFSEAPSRTMAGEKSSPSEFYCKCLLCWTLQNSKDQELVHKFAIESLTEWNS